MSSRRLSDFDDLNEEHIDEEYLLTKLPVEKPAELINCDDNGVRNRVRIKIKCLLNLLMNPKPKSTLLAMTKKVHELNEFRKYQEGNYQPYLHHQILKITSTKRIISKQELKAATVNLILCLLLGDV